MLIYAVDGMDGMYSRAAASARKRQKNIMPGWLVVDFSMIVSIEEK